jgi:hypothetical protein
MKLHNDRLEQMERQLFAKDQEDGVAFASDSARIFHFYDESDDMFLVNSDKDIYELLENNDVAEELSLFSGTQFVVVTHGWAAKLDKDADENNIRPSQHPSKRRVRVAIACNSREQISFVRFEDDPNEVMIDSGGRGSLSEACKSLIKKIKTKKAGK